MKFIFYNSNTKLASCNTVITVANLVSKTMYCILTHTI